MKATRYYCPISVQSSPAAERFLGIFDFPSSSRFTANKLNTCSFSHQFQTSLCTAVVIVGNLSFYVKCTWSARARVAVRVLNECIIALSVVINLE